MDNDLFIYMYVYICMSSHNSDILALFLQYEGIIYYNNLYYV